MRKVSVERSCGFLQNFLRGLDPDSHLLLNINFSSRTTSMDVQRNLEANVEKRTKDLYGPPPGKRLVVFMDDMNMPQVSISKRND